MATAQIQPHQFKILVEHDEDGYFVASVPALPGCHTQAKTLPQLRQRIKEAIKLCLAVAQEDPEYRQRIELLVHEPSFVGVEVITLDDTPDTST